MSAPKHTAGPWAPNSQHTGPTVWRVEVESVAWSNDGYIIADLWGPEAEANARLIAAAPDLLAVAIESEAAAQERHDFDDLEACALEDKAHEPEYLRRKALRAAIATATGARA